jgi:hypothetical protein
METEELPMTKSRPSRRLFVLIAHRHPVLVAVLTYCYTFTALSIVSDVFELAGVYTKYSMRYWLPFTFALMPIIATFQPRPRR